MALLPKKTVTQIGFLKQMQKISETGCIAVGRKTYEQYQEELYPVADVLNIVLTKDTTKKSAQSNVSFVTSVEEALQIAQEKGHNKVLLIGGGITNGTFLEKNKIDEIILSVHPIILGDGIKLFEDTTTELQLKLLKTQALSEGLVQLQYEVLHI